jgi:hypothetical protein
LAVTLFLYLPAFIVVVHGGGTGLQFFQELISK